MAIGISSERRRTAVRRKTTAAASARRDILTGGVTIAAIILFTGTGGSVISSFVKMLAGDHADVDQMLGTALLLNIALILFGWRRYADLSREVKERSAAEEHAHYLASTDPLTGLLNRRSMTEECTELLALAAPQQKSVALLVLDIDHFKTVNDINGHMIGDALLKVVSETIEAHVPPMALTARLGGDEFACAFLFDPAASGHVDMVAERIVTQLAHPCNAAGVMTHISASIGLARSDADCDTVDALMRRADIAMYVAKNQGRNRYYWFDLSMERELKARNAVETGLREGIPRGEFVPYYEPQIDLTTGQLHGFEMLARWQHPIEGLLMPDSFIPVAEESGLIGDLSLSVMRQAFVEARNWDHSLILSVNISPWQLKDPWLAQKIVKLLVETGFQADRLEVEITETALFENLGLAQAIVSSLKNQGIRIALDDFGTGYSSLAHLRALPFDRIKIDRSFVTSMNDSADSAAIVNAITRLGNSLGLPITAEGIENGIIEQRLRDLGCAKGQGWHFGKPMEASQVRLMLSGQELKTERRAG